MTDTLKNILKQLNKLSGDELRLLYDTTCSLVVRRESHEKEEALKIVNEG